jgi:hypothetical protein
MIIERTPRCVCVSLVHLVSHTDDLVFRVTVEDQLKRLPIVSQGDVHWLESGKYRVNRGTFGFSIWFDGDIRIGEASMPIGITLDILRRLRINSLEYR